MYEQVEGQRRGSRGGEWGRRREDGGFSSVTTQRGGVEGLRRGQGLNGRGRGWRRRRVTGNKGEAEC